MTILTDYNPEYAKPSCNTTTPLFVGLECEIEGIRQEFQQSEVWRPESDGSLRNNGVEFISQPIPIQEAVSEFQCLHSKLKYKEDEAFSERTSIHVHVNCLALDCRQVYNIVMMYAVFEEAFFKMCDPNRRHNIHCVALTETFLPAYYRSELSTLISRWHKYTALNLKPLTRYGTIEFRHMQGTNDAKLLQEWLFVIEKLFELGVHFDKYKMLDKPSLQSLYQSLFFNTRLANQFDNVYPLLYNSILDMKVSCV